MRACGNPTGTAAELENRLCASLPTRAFVSLAVLHWSSTVGRAGRLDTLRGVVALLSQSGGTAFSKWGTSLCASISHR
jgi:hypothetical protein